MDAGDAVAAAESAAAGVASGAIDAFSAAAVASSSDNEAMEEDGMMEVDIEPIRIAIDKGPNVYRKRIREMVEAEETEYLGDPEGPTFVQHD